MTALMTAAPVIDRAPDWIPTGNLHVSLPAISRADAGIYRVGVLSMGANALLELVGSEVEGRPFLQPLIELDGQRLPLEDLTWERLDYWLPHYTATAGGLKVTGTIYAPPGENGFVYLLEVDAGRQAAGLRLGMEGWWKGVEAVVFKSRQVEAARHTWHDPWSRSFVGEARAGLPVLAWGLQPSLEGELSTDGDMLRWICPVEAGTDGRAVVAFYVAINLESDGARTGALHLRRRGWQNLLAETRAWLRERILPASDPALERLLNENLFFNYYYAQGICLDNGELALVTSRSNSYYVCAAYWARDALLWSFPALLLTDRDHARAALRTGWTRYLPLAGHHALYINGRNLYPGFELDEACAPIIALGHYLDQTGDWDFVRQGEIRTALPDALAAIVEHYHPGLRLYGTFLTPHDDPTDHPYLTYNNVLVWRALNILASVWEFLSGTGERPARLREQAAALARAIRERCVVAGPFGPQFAGAVNTAGEAVIADLPGASWSLFPYYRFCSPEDPVYRNSLRWISSEHNPHHYPGRFDGAGADHFPFPSSFGLANRLLCGEADALAMARELRMDHGLACESFDAETGIVKTGAAFATMAGFLAYSLHHALQGGGDPL